MTLKKVTFTCMIVSCRATKSGKGYMLTCLQGESSFMVFSKRSFPVSVPGTVDLTCDINCYVDRNSGEYKEFLSISE